MLHADHHDQRGIRYASSSKDSATAHPSQFGQREAEELDELLASQLSPNKRAVVEALLRTWEEGQRGVHLRQTG